MDKETEILLQAHERRIAVLEEDVKEYKTLSKEVAILAEKLDYTIEELRKANIKIDSILSRPQNRWEKIVEGVILAVLTGLVAYVLAKLGLK